MIVTLSRIIKYGWRGFLRNGLLSVSTISIMVLAAAVFEGVILFNVIGKGAVQSIQEKIDISVYFKSNIHEDSILNFKKTLEKFDEVMNIEYISRDQALEEFKKRHAGEAVITQTLDELDVNPLLASLNIKAKEPSQYKAIAGYLENADLQNSAEKITYAQNQVVINRLIAFISILKSGGLVLTLFLSFLAVMVIFTTIRLAIYSNSDQIGIMRLVGASNSFIRGPYIVEGIIYGVIGGILSFLILVPLINFISPYINNFIPEVDLKMYFQTNLFTILFYQLIFSIGLGIVSSIIAVRRYLHV
ncbi:MAG: permease-like cell division protein FtsX [Patescibacteria group bacterium]|nr:permease-like cell division protein FtsX [Patescibacteria group bacterium]